MDQIGHHTSESHADRREAGRNRPQHTEHTATDFARRGELENCRQIHHHKAIECPANHGERESQRHRSHHTKHSVATGLGEHEHDQHSCTDLALQSQNSCKHVSQNGTQTVRSQQKSVSLWPRAKVPPNEYRQQNKHRRRKKSQQRGGKHHCPNAARVPHVAQPHPQTFFEQPELFPQAFALFRNVLRNPDEQLAERREEKRDSVDQKQDRRAKNRVDDPTSPLADEHR